MKVHESTLHSFPPSTQFIVDETGGAQKGRTMTEHPDEISLPDKSSTTYRQGPCWLVDYCVCPDTSPVVSYQGLRVLFVGQLLRLS
ncbi:hypothetical protein BHE74_00030685 [Ensete ventricosum]|nr:hypothetical protein BHE74_00030685 [Ensete ventricosum]